MNLWVKHPDKGDTNETKVQSQVRDVLSRIFSRVPSVKLGTIRSKVPVGGQVVDWLAEVKTPSGPYTIIGELKSVGQPRYLKNAIGQLILAKQDLSQPAYGMVIAPYISDGGAKMLEKAGFGYADFVGNYRVELGDIYLERSGQSPDRPTFRPIRKFLMGKSARIPMALLREPDRSWTVNELVQATGVSQSLVSNVKKVMASQGLVAADYAGKITLRNPSELLNLWRDIYNFRANFMRNYRAEMEVEALEEALEKELSRGNIDHGFTLFSGARQFIKVPSYSRVFVYVSEDSSETVDRLRLQEEELDPNVSLIVPKDMIVFQGIRELGGFKVVHPVQLYLDLYTCGLRAKDTAEELRKVVIRL